MAFKMSAFIQGSVLTLIVMFFNWSKSVNRYQKQWFKVYPSFHLCTIEYWRPICIPYQCKQSILAVVFQRSGFNCIMAPEPARAGAEDGSSADNPVTNIGTEQTTRLMISIPEAPTTTAGHKLQSCLCGWTKVTPIQGLKIHQEKKGCLKKGQKGNRIDSYFWEAGRVSRLKFSSRTESTACRTSTPLSQRRKT